MILTPEEAGKIRAALEKARDDYFCNSVLKGGRETRSGELLEDRGIEMERALEALASSPDVAGLPPCDKCGKQQAQLGALHFSAPDDNAMCKKTHICIACDAALSCDAFRKWMGGVGERCLPDVDPKLDVMVQNINGTKSEPWTSHVKEWDEDTKRSIREGSGRGPTPRAAVLAAIANIKTEG